MNSDKPKRGFALMDPETQRAVASKGGKSAHRQGKGHEFSLEEAREVGAMGGRAISKDRAHMAEIGRRGGFARGRNLGARQASGHA